LVFSYLKNQSIAAFKNYCNWITTLIDRSARPGQFLSRMWSTPVVSSTLAEGARSSRASSNFVLYCEGYA